MKSLLPILLLCATFVSASDVTPPAAGNVIFLHPDGTGLGHWSIARLVTVGQDGQSHWDRLERLAVYRPHQKGWISTTSHAGATTHAYGRKVHPDSYGLDRDQPLTALSGKPLTLMQEARAAGLRVGVVNTGHIAEPGTGVFLASSKSRGDYTGIAATIVASGADLIFCAGEKYLLPKGVMGTHGEEGVRADGRNLLEEARKAGYRVILTREELLALPAATEKVLGIFAADNTYHDLTEQELGDQQLPLYEPQAPTFAEMTAVALKVLSHDKSRRFFLMAEEEGTDNFSNKMNAAGMVEALKRADAAIGVARNFVDARSDTLMLVAADSDAGHPTVIGEPNWTPDTRLPAKTDSGAPVDGQFPGGAPFLTAPDALGKVHAFGIAWPHSGDGSGSAITKAHGHGSGLLGVDVDNTGLYRICYQVLFGRVP